MDDYLIPFIFYSILILTIAVPPLYSIHLTFQWHKAKSQIITESPNSIQESAKYLQLTNSTIKNKEK